MYLPVHPSARPPVRQSVPPSVYPSVSKLWLRPTRFTHHRQDPGGRVLVSHVSSEVVLETVPAGPGGRERRRQRRPEIGAALIGINGVSIEGSSWEAVSKNLIGTGRPLQLRFKEGKSFS